ncbi:MAG: hypothetical protein NTW80_11605 [Deltaproteobacteria bacterium]|nr:hypothetical protein [Deltaproteobacteria bacterium]
MNTLLSCAAVFLILFFLSEDFQTGLQRLRSVLQQKPQLKIVAYPLGALLFLGAAVLIIHLLVHFAADCFSYD